MKRHLLSLAAPLCFLTSCDHKTESTGFETNVLAKVAEESITIETLEKRLAHRRQEPTNESVRNLLDAMIAEEALAAKAMQVGLLEDPEVQASIKRLLAQKLMETELQPRLESAAPTDQQIAEFYKAHSQDFTQPEQRRVAALFVKPSEANKVLIKQWHQDLQEAPDAMETLALRHSQDEASRYRGGDLGWLRQGQAHAKHPGLDRTAFSLTADTPISDIIETPRGLYILKLLESQPATTRTLSEVSTTIKRRLHAENEAAIRARFHQEAQAAVNIQRNAQGITNFLSQWPESPTEETPAFPMVTTAALR